MRLLDPSELGDASAAVGDSPAARYVRSWASKGRSLIGNVETRLLLLDTGAHQFPVSVNDGESHGGNCYVVSPLAAYGAYAQEEVNRMKMRRFRLPLSWLVGVATSLLRSIQADRVVFINNWLLSTNLYPAAWKGDDLPEITQLMLTTYPQHAFAFRSLNSHCNGPLIARLKRLGYLSVPSRQVYVFDGRAGVRSDFLSHHNSQMDARLLSRSRYRLLHGCDLRDEDFERLEQLYNRLYLEKYCHLNPHYKAEWLRRGHREGWLQLQVLQSPEGRIDGVVGWFATDSTLSAPIVGYDTGLPMKVGLYRQLTQLCFQETAARRTLLNFSSGASQFKWMRGGQPRIEVSMIYVKHLPLSRRIVWGLLSILTRAVGVPVMKIFKL